MPAAAFLDEGWQERQAVTRVGRLREVLGGAVAADFLVAVEAGVRASAMSLRLTPYLMSLVDWDDPWRCPVRRQFLPVADELEPDHPGLRADSLAERASSPAPGLVHRYPDKALLVALDTCPVYCQYCTRSYSVGLETETATKLRLGAGRIEAALDHVRVTPAIEDVVVSGGDAFRLKADALRQVGLALVAIPHVRRVRFATKGLAVLPMRLLRDGPWRRGLFEVAAAARRAFKHLCVHTHFNHPREVTDLTEAAMRPLFDAGITVRNQTVLLRGVNDAPDTLLELTASLGRLHVHPYYVFACDMVPGSEHYRLPISRVAWLEKQVRGATAGFNTPAFVVDTCGGGGKRVVHSHEHYDPGTGIAAYAAPRVRPGELFFHFDPLRGLDADRRKAWRDPRRRGPMLEEAAAIARARLRADAALATGAGAAEAPEPRPGGP